MTQLFIEQLPREIQEQIKGLLQLPDRTEELKELNRSSKNSRNNPGGAPLGFFAVLRMVVTTLLVSMLCSGAVVLFVWLCAGIAERIGG